MYQCHVISTALCTEGIHSGEADNLIPLSNPSTHIGSQLPYEHVILLYVLVLERLAHLLEHSIWHCMF